ncbi:MAG: hypothetical protein AAFQ08_02290, partial [Bacteroidota bacterium]
MHPAEEEDKKGSNVWAPQWSARLITARRSSLKDLAVDADNHAAIDQLDAIDNLQAFVQAFNDPATPAKDKQGLKYLFKQLNILFEQQDFTTLDEAQVQEYSILARVKARDPETCTLLENYVEVWRGKMKEDKGKKKFAKGIADCLRFLDLKAFKKDTTLLRELAETLLDTLTDSADQYNEDNYPSHKETLSAIHQALLNISAISDKAWDFADPTGLYARFTAKLAKLAQTNYYPLKYQVQLLQQNLLRLKRDATTWETVTESGTKAYLALKGVSQIVQGVVGVATLRLDLNQIEEGMGNLFAACSTAGTNVWAGKGNLEAFLKRLPTYTRESWYDPLQELAPIAALCTLSDAPATLYWQRYEQMLSEVLKEETQKRLRPEGRCALHYGLVQQLSMIAFSNVHCRAACTAWLGRLLLEEAYEPWQKDAAVVKALIAALEMVVANDRAKAKEQAQAFLEQIPAERTSYTEQATTSFSWLAAMAPCSATQPGVGSIARERWHSNLPAYLSALSPQQADQKATQQNSLYRQVVKQIKADVEAIWQVRAEHAAAERFASKTKQ